MSFDANPNMRRSKTALLLIGSALVMLLAAAHVAAQAQPPLAKPAETETATQVFFLKHAWQQNDLNDIQTDLRNMVPRAKIYGVSTQNAITVRGTADELQAVQKLIAELDRPLPAYRLTFTITDSGKTATAQHYAFVAALGQRETFKLGSRIPIATEVKGEEGKQIQYQDVGIGIEAMLTGSPEGLTLRAKVEQTSLGEEKPQAASQAPLIRQAVLDGISEIMPGKPLTLGSLDAPDSARRQQIEVVAEPLH